MLRGSLHQRLTGTAAAGCGIDHHILDPCLPARRYVVPHQRQHPGDPAIQPGGEQRRAIAAHNTFYGLAGECPQPGRKLRHEPCERLGEFIGYLCHTLYFDRHTSRIFFTKLIFFSKPRLFARIPAAICRKKSIFVPFGTGRQTDTPTRPRATLRRIVRRATGAVADGPPPARRKRPGRGGGRSPGAGKPGEYPGRIPAETVKIMENMNKYAFPLAALLFAACNSGEETTTTQIQEPVATILEYTPAPGQFINGTMAGFDHVASEADALRYAADRLASNNWVSLGGWGGRIVAAFAEPVPNTGGYDLYVKGNQFDTSSEPGIVWVSQDANGDGAPNDTWYELRGSEYDNAETIRGYKITYTRPAEADAPVAWSDNTGGSGTIDRVKEHTQAYYPEWLGEQFTFEGTRLPDNIGKAGEKWTMEPFAWGYADNYSASDRTGMTNRLRISDAVTADGAPANLAQVDFIMVQTGVNAKAPLIGEVSTEVSGIGCYRTVTKKQ